MVNVEVVLIQQLLTLLCLCGSQLDVADGDFCAGLDGLQRHEGDALLAEALHGIGRAGVVDQGACWEQAYTFTPSSTKKLSVQPTDDKVLMVHTSIPAKFNFEAVFVAARVLPYAQYSPCVAWLQREAKCR